MDWGPTRRRLYSILYVGKLASVSWSVGELTGYHTPVWNIWNLLYYLLKKIHGRWKGEIVFNYSGGGSLRSFFFFFLTKNFSTDSKLTSTQEIPDPLEKSDRSYTCAAGKQGCCSRQSGCNSSPSTSQWCQLKWPWSTKGGTYGN